MKPIYSFIIFSFLCFSIPYCFSQDNSIQESSKEIHKNFKTQNGDTLNMYAYFGKISIVEWDKDEIDFYIQIIGNGKTQNEAKNYLDSINILLYQKDRLVVCNTDIASVKKSSSKSKTGLNVVYKLHVPSNIYLNIKAVYGDIVIENDMHSNIQMEVIFGNFEGQYLKGKQNNLLLAYGNVKLKGAENLNLSLKFAFNSNLENIKNLSVNSLNSNIKGGKIVNLDITSNFDKIKMDTIGYLKGILKHSELVINTLLSSAIVDIDYGNIDIKNVYLNFDTIDIQAQYTPIQITLTENHNFSSYIEADHGSINMKNIASQKKETNQYQQRFTGIIGKDKNPKSKVRIKNKFGIIKIAN